MSPPGVKTWHALSGPPRASGDEPATRLPSLLNRLSAPRERG